MKNSKKSFNLLYGALGILLAASVLLLFRMDDIMHDTITSIATLAMSAASIVVGISTVAANQRMEDMEKKLNQPIYTIKTNFSKSDGKDIYDNEEYIIINEGAKTKSKTDVLVNSLIEIEYYNSSNSGSRIRKMVPVFYFKGGSTATNNLDGVIQRSKLSGNNNESFGNLYTDALQYEARHPGVYLTVQIKHYFSFDYVDVYGEKHHIVKTKDNEIDPNEFTKIKEEAEQKIKHETIYIDKLNLGNLIDLLLKEK